jgi:hypothetical protein
MRIFKKSYTNLLVASFLLFPSPSTVLFWDNFFDGIIPFIIFQHTYKRNFFRSKETSFKVPVLSADVTGPADTSRVVPSHNRGKEPAVRGKKAGNRGKGTGVRGIGASRVNRTAGEISTGKI